MKRLLLLLLVLVIAAGPLAACGAPVQNPDPLPTTQEPTQSHTETTSPLQPEPIGDLTPVISEVMPDNRDLVLGLEFDWIELYNPADTSGSLKGFYLTDDPTMPRALSLEAYAMEAEGYLTVILDDSAPFQLSEQGETLYLFRGEEQIGSLTFGAAEDGCSFDQSGICAYATPGHPNTEEGYLAFLESRDLPELVISEVLASNSKYSFSRMYYDYVEVENRSDKAVDLSEYYLFDGWENKDRFHFPRVILQPGQFYTVLCSGNSDLGDNHAPFEIGSAGETLYLAHQGTRIDALKVPGDLKANESYGRCGKIPMYLETPTPGSANSQGFLSGIAAPAANLASGVYDDPVDVELTGEGTIYYTLNGTQPTRYSRVYTGPIRISGVTTIRAICISGQRSSLIQNYTYVVGQEHTLPVLVVAMTEGSRDLLTNNVESSTEYSSVMTLIEDGEEKFSIPLGIRLHGNDSRKGAKQNFQLRFRSIYGAGSLKYRLFPNRDIDEFGSLLLKGGSEDFGGAMLRDELCSDLADGTSALYTLAIKPVILYMGGRYWGVYYLRERYSADYVASHLDVSKESVDLLYSTGADPREGSGTEFFALKNYVRFHDMSLPENYAYLAERIDVNSLMDWYIFRSYLNDRDLANIRRFRSSESDGKWRWMFYDMDWGCYIYGTKPLSAIIEDHNGEPVLIRGLLASEAGRDAFLKRYAYMMNTVLNEAYINERMDLIVAQIEPEMVRDGQRWYRSMANWRSHLNTVRTFARDSRRVRTILSDIRSYFHLSDEQMEYYFGDLNRK